MIESRLDSLPHELLDLIMQHATSALRADSADDTDILHRAAAWSSLASVNRRQASVSSWHQPRVNSALLLISAAAHLFHPVQCQHRFCTLTT